MITTLLFDIGGTLLTGKHTGERMVEYCGRLIRRLQEYGISLELPAAALKASETEASGAAVSDAAASGTLQALRPVSPEVLARMLAENAEEYKHWSEKSRYELPPARIWNEFYLKEFGIGEERLAPIAEELSFCYDYERGSLMRRPYLKETMEELSAMGIRLGIITNMISSTFAPHILKEYGIDKLMECLIISSEVGCRKPDPAIFRLAMEQMGVGPEETGYVGDTLSRDIMGARNAGLGLAVMIRSEATTRRDTGLKAEGWLKPDYVIQELNELPGILRDINRPDK